MSPWIPAVIVVIPGLLIQSLLAVYVYGKLTQKVADHDGWLSSIENRLAGYVTRNECMAKHGNGRAMVG